MKKKKDHAPMGKRSLSLEGELTIYQANESKQLLLESLAQCSELELDLSKLDAIDSAGLQLLLMLKRQAVHDGKTLRCTGHSAEVVDIFDVYNVAAFFGDPLVIPRQ